MGAAPPPRLPKKTLVCVKETRYDSRDRYIYEERIVARCSLCGKEDASPWLGAGAYDVIIGPPEFRKLIRRHKQCREKVRGNLSLVEPNHFGTLSIVEEGTLSYVE